MCNALRSGGVRRRPGKAADSGSPKGLRRVWGAAPPEPGCHPHQRVGGGGRVGENGLDKIGGCPNHFSPFVRQYPVHCDPTELPLDPENLNLRRKAPEENIMFLESGRDQGGGAGLQQRVKEKKSLGCNQFFLHSDGSLRHTLNAKVEPESLSSGIPQTEHQEKALLRGSLRQRGNQTKRTGPNSYTQQHVSLSGPFDEGFLPRMSDPLLA